MGWFYHQYIDKGSDGMAHTEAQRAEVIAACLLAGRILVENGSEISRAVDTMERIAKNAGMESVQLFVTVTGIMLSVENQPNAQVAGITRRTIDLDKVARVNDLSRSFAAHKIELSQMVARLNEIDNNTPTFPFWQKFLASGMLSAVLLVIFTKEYVDAPAGFVIGAIGYAVFYFFNRQVKIQFISEFFASLAIGLLAALAVKLHLGVYLDNIIIGGVMPLVPGVPITNAVRDLVAGNLISGPARAVEALLSAMAIGFGIVCVLHFV